MLNPFEHQNHATPFSLNPAVKKRLNDVKLKAVPKTKTSKASTSANYLFHGQAPSFNQSWIVRQNAEFGKKIKMQREELYLESLFQSGEINEIVDFLLNQADRNEYFQTIIFQIQKDFAKELNSASFINSKEWKILAALHLFDQGTFEHCIRTYLLAKEKLEKNIAKIGEEIKKEGIALDEFYLACLFHDIGKLAVPKFILNNSATDEEWTFHFMSLPKDQQDEILVDNFLVIPDAYREDHEKMHAFFEEKMFRAVEVVPLNTVLGKEQLDLLTERRLDGSLPLTKVMHAHEKKSKEILEKLGYKTEALLAGNHHNYNYQNSKEKNPISNSALQCLEFTADIIHMADVQDALSNDRPNHGRKSAARMLAFIVNHAKIGKIKDSWAAATWINDELKKIDPYVLLSHIKEMKTITDFLYEYLPTDEIFIHQAKQI